MIPTRRLVTIVKRLTPSLVIASVDGVQHAEPVLWSLIRVRKPTKCVATGEAILRRHHAWSPVNQSIEDRSARLARHVLAPLTNSTNADR